MQYAAVLGVIALDFSGYAWSGRVNYAERNFFSRCTEYSSGFREF